MKIELMAFIGNTKWTDILQKSNSISWGSDKDTISQELSFNSLVDLTEGTHIIFNIDSKKTFMGMVIKKSKSKLSYSYTCFDYSFYLNKNETIIQFNKMAADLALKQLCGKFGIKINCVGITTLISKIYKDMTLNAIIEDILEIAELELGTKYIKEMINDILYIRKQKEYRISPKFILAEDLTVNSSIEEMKNKVLVVSNDEANNRILATSSDATNIKKFGSLQEVLTVEAKDIGKAKNIADNHLKTNNKIFKDTTLNILVISGGEEIRANRSIGLSIKSMGIDGLYNIKSASNVLENGQHKCALTLEW